MPDITTLYHELIRHKQESLDPIDRQLLHQQQATHKINRTQSHQGDIFTRECLKIVRVYWVFVTKKLTSELTDKFRMIRLSNYNTQLKLFVLHTSLLQPAA